MENLKLVRDIFLTSFIIGFIVLTIVGLLFMFNVDFCAAIANKMIGVEKEDYLFAVMLIFGMAKNFLFFVMLVPAIAMSMKLCKCKKLSS